MIAQSPALSLPTLTRLEPPLSLNMLPMPLASN
jgi:hypothetical protein